MGFRCTHTRPTSFRCVGEVSGLFSSCILLVIMSLHSVSNQTADLLVTVFNWDGRDLSSCSLYHSLEDLLKLQSAAVTFFGPMSCLPFCLMSAYHPSPQALTCGYVRVYMCGHMSRCIALRAKAALYSSSMLSLSASCGIAPISFLLSSFLSLSK